MRYMAPEGKWIQLSPIRCRATSLLTFHSFAVALNQHYTEKADVYSFSILLWQICSMHLPYDGLSDASVQRKVVHCGYRPTIDQKWPSGIRRLLHDCYGKTPRRPSMDTVCSILKQEINELSDKKLVDQDVLASTRSALSVARHN